MYVLTESRFSLFLKASILNSTSQRICSYDLKCRFLPRYYYKGIFPLKTNKERQGATAVNSSHESKRKRLDLKPLKSFLIWNKQKLALKARRNRDRNKRQPMNRSHEAESKCSDHLRRFSSP